MSSSHCNGQSSCKPQNYVKYIIAYVVTIIYCSSSTMMQVFAVVKVKMALQNGAQTQRIKDHCYK